MKLRLCRLLAIAAFVSCFLGSVQTLAQNVYITNDGSGNVSVIDTATNTVTATIAVGVNPFGLAVTPDGSTVYVANAGFGANTVSAIATATNRVTTAIPVGSEPGGVAVTPDGSKVYVANFLSNNVSVIATATNTVTAAITVGSGPVAFGVFIIRPSFAGTQGFSNCHGLSVSALARRWANAAAAALGLPSVKA